ncbi:MAG: hypothetical protein L0332_20040, partial [Chloroflexi bacterium]|nr:hypothetical protein [Chloroflexota bacterium]
NNRMKFMALAVLILMTLFLFAPVYEAQASYLPVKKYTGASFLVTGNFSAAVDVRRIVTITYKDTSDQDQSASFTETVDCTLEGDAKIDNDALQLDGAGDFLSCEISSFAERVQWLAEKELNEPWPDFVAANMRGIWAEATVQATQQDTWLPILAHSAGDIHFQVYNSRLEYGDQIQTGVQGVTVPPSNGFEFRNSTAQRVRGHMVNACGTPICLAHYYLSDVEIGQGVSFYDAAMPLSDGTTTLYIGGDGGGFSGSIENFAWDPYMCPGCF